MSGGLPSAETGMCEIRVSGGPNEDLMHQIKLVLGQDVMVSSANVYLVEGATPEGAQLLADQLFTDPNTQTATTEPRTDWDDGTKLLVDPKPGVTEPYEEFGLEAAKDLGVPVTRIAFGTEHRFIGIDRNTIQNIVDSKILFNPTTHRIREGVPETLQIKGETPPIENIPISHLDETGLETLSQKQRMFLDAQEMVNIRDHFLTLGREPTDGELKHLAGAWSEHCCHKTFNAKIKDELGNDIDPLFRQLVDASHPYLDERDPPPYIDNAGGFYFYDDMVIVMKVETHNSPSAIEPYGGSMTGSGGVFRDIMGTGQGAKNILSIDIFCFARPDFPINKLPSRTLPPAYLLQRCVDGVRDYGNRMGIPTANGSIHFHDDFRAKPTVMVGALGIVPEKYSRKGHPQEGDFVVAIGGKTGLDGIGGATFSSGSMTEKTAELDAGAVQIGNAMEEQRMQEALLEARDAGLIRAITDCGAAGFGSAIGEMGEEIGVNVELEKAPVKYEGLAPWQIWVSESQERMVAAIEPDKYLEFVAICAKHKVESTALGTFGTKGGTPRLNVTYHGEQLIDLDYDFLKNGRTQREMVAHWQAPEIEERLPEEINWDDALKKLMSHGNIHSNQPVVQQYDHEVQGTSVTKPFSGVHRDAPNDAVVLQPILDKPYGLVQAHGMNPVLNNFDPYKGSKWAFAEAMANYVSGGGNPDAAYLADNFVTATPDEHVMGALVKMVKAYTDCIHAVKRPVITGKDSLSSRYESSKEKIDVPPVLTVTVAGKILDIKNTVTTDIKKPGSRMVLVGKMDYESMGGSAFYDVADGSMANVPDVDLEVLPETLKGVHGAIQTGHVLAVHDISEGGIAAAASEMCFGGDCGLEISAPVNIDSTNFMFNETAGCFLVEVADGVNIGKLFGNAPIMVIGQTTKNKRLSMSSGGNQVFDVSVDELKAAWKRPMEEIFA